MVALDGVLETFASDEPHGVKRPAIRVGAEAVDRDNARMFEAGSDPGLQQEPGTAVRPVGIGFLDLLESHFALQHLLQGDRHLAESTLGVGPQDAKAPSQSATPGGCRARLATV